MKSIAFIAFVSLLASSVALAPDAQAGDSVGTTPERVLTNAGDTAPGASPIADEEIATMLGVGWRSDFWCGAAAGAGLVLSATGVFTPVGIGMSAAGIYCALYL